MWESSPEPWVKSSKSKLSCALVASLFEASWQFSTYRSSPLHTLILTSKESLLSSNSKEPLLWIGKGKLPAEYSWGINMVEWLKDSHHAC